MVCLNKTQTFCYNIAGDTEKPILLNSVTRKDVGYEFKDGFPDSSPKGLNRSNDA